MIRENLVKAKTLLVQVGSQITDEIDNNSIEYLIDSIDYLLSEKIKINYDVVSILLQDILVAGTYNRDSKLLVVASLLEDILEELPCTT